LILPLPLWRRHFLRSDIYRRNLYLSAHSGKLFGRQLCIEEVLLERRLLILLSDQDV